MSLSVSFPLPLRRWLAAVLVAVVVLCAGMPACVASARTDVGRTSQIAYDSPAATTTSRVTAPADAIRGYDQRAHFSRLRLLTSDGVLAAKAPTRAARGGESPAAAYGRRIHQEFDYGPGYVKEFRGLPSGRRPDAVNFDDRVVAELKPNNPAAIRRGQRQLDVYRRELEQEFGGTWRTRLETYDRPTP